MVFYFTSGDEDLIKYGWPEDIWFHVDKLSSAHVYLRLHKVSPRHACLKGLRGAFTVPGCGEPCARPSWLPGAAKAPRGKQSADHCGGFIVPGS
ncbi:coiled-coil domain-containing protein 25 isoform X2 [Oxyura jamaicensis]|uniref:coiled-coil domain-containing protein 25 isoform X2 n=1 Tax=Oxyura jamaicensis TaxID=8884 RepID=UPI0015A5CD52|nr:coiled-coil domain-containing protein 25 isoform X2 [Oxyura jamaicensis]